MTFSCVALSLAPGWHLPSRMAAFQVRRCGATGGAFETCRKGKYHVRKPLRRLRTPEIRLAGRWRAAGHDAQSRQPSEFRRYQDARGNGRGLARYRCGPGCRRGHPARLRQGVLARRRFQHDRRDHRRPRLPHARTERGARHHLQCHQLFPADDRRHERGRRRRRPRRRHGLRYHHCHEKLPHHRRPYQPGRGGGRSLGHLLAAAVRHGQGEILSDDLRSAHRRGGGTDRADLAGGRGRRPGGRIAAGRAPARRRRPHCDQPHENGPEQLVPHERPELRCVAGPGIPGL